MKKQTLTIAIFLSIILGGCQLGGGANTEVSTTDERPVQELLGTISKTSLGYTLMSGGKTVEIVSKKVDLGKYVNKEVGVVGEYSGTTLYVDEVK